MILYDHPVDLVAQNQKRGWMHLAGFKSTQDDVSQGPRIRVMIDRIELYGLAEQFVAVVK